MLSKFRYLFKILDDAGRRNFTRLLLLNFLSPAIDIFSISMLLPILHTLANDTDNRRAIVQMLGLGILVLGKAAFDLLLVKGQSDFMQENVRRLSCKLMKLLQSEDLLAHNARTGVQSLALVRHDVTASLGILLNGKLLAVNSVSLCGLASIIVYSTGMPGAATVAVALAAMALIYRSNRHRVRIYGERLRDIGIRLNSLVIASFRSYKTIRVEGNGSSGLARFDESSGEYAAEAKKYAVFSELMHVMLHDMLQAAVFFALAAIALCGINLSSHVSTLVVFVTALLKLLPVTGSILRAMANVAYTDKSYVTFHDNLNLFNQLPPDSPAKTPHTITSLEKGVFVRNLSFRYPNGNSIFENAYIDIPKGKTVAVIGTSGSGKTTFLDIIVGLLKPQQGEIFYDDVNLTENPHGTLGNVVSYIPQSIYLNGSSVRDNVAFWTPDQEVDDARVIQCLQIAKIYDDIKALPNGIHTLIGENGTFLSGGQRQRIALARALYKNAELLVMDEATAALDMETEAAVIDSIRHAKQGKTLVVVTHHRNLAQECDIIYQIEHRNFTKLI